MKIAHFSSLALISFAASVLTACEAPPPVKPEPKPTPATWLDAIRTKHVIPGMGAGRLDQGQFNGYVSGVRRLGSKPLVHPGDRFHLGSCTKAMTSTLAAIFVQRGQLRWDSTMIDLFPESGNSMNPAYKSLTLAAMTSHRSGFVDLGSVNQGALWQSLWNETLDPIKGRQNVSQAMLAQTPVANPDTAFEYNNANYILAGAALERIAGKSWEDLMRQELFAPLGMTSCGFGMKSSTSTVSPDQPWGHREKNGVLIPVVPDFFADNPPTFGPAGTVHCSIGDWAKFLQLHIDGFNGRDTAILKAESFVELHTRYPGQSYTPGGWGRHYADWAGGDALNHGGSNTTNAANVWIAPIRGFAVLSTANASHPAAGKAIDESIGVLIERGPASGSNQKMASAAR